MDIQEIKTALSVLRKARKILEPSGSWIKDVYAADKQGKGVEINSRKACKFCSLGAGAKAAGGVHEFEFGPAYPYLDCAFAVAAGNISAFLSGGDVVTVNDAPSTKHLHVQMAFDFAILMAQDDLKAAKKATKTAREVK